MKISIVDHSEPQFNTNYNDVSDKLSRWFDLELSNKKPKQAKKLLLEYRGVKLMGRRLLDRSSTNCIFLASKSNGHKRKQGEMVQRVNEKKKTMVLRLISSMPSNHALIVMNQSME